MLMSSRLTSRVSAMTTRLRVPELRRPGLQFSTIRSRIYVTLVAIVILTLVVVGLTTFLLLGGYQDRVDQSRLRELATAWGPELFSEEREGRTLERTLRSFETDDRLIGSIVDELDVVVLGITSAGEVVRTYETGDRFYGEQLDLDFEALNRNDVVEGQVTTADGERLSYVLTGLGPQAQQRQGDVCCIVVGLVGGSRSAVLADLAPQMLIAGIVALVVASLVGFLVSRSIYRPIQRVAAASRSVARGQLQQRVDVGGSQEAQELATSFNQMTEEVERQQTALRDFLANVSHDLQTPLTSINGFSQALMDDVVKDDEQRNAYRIIEDESRRLLRLVEGLLDLSRIEAGQVRVESKPVNVSSLLEHVGDLFALRAQELDVRLTVAVNDGAEVGDVLGDWDRLDQVLGNLVDNALRHTPPGGDVELSATVESRSSVSIAVADTGVGIPEEAIPNLFDRYYKSDRPGAQGGTGLGLAIARELVRAQGGEIRVSSEQGVGTTFHIVLLATQDGAERAQLVDGSGPELG
ncbi:MAG: HAMP domain-containing histidine kinase [Chloroflexi bacterium]|nr:HAMP domain-containing histidine kinase [Chloroflexota bacterium]MYB23419.1 HAMP domain-containing histidine kinase [Chloroflexota bacterium]MYF23485.1 HAMP domain-containing histidine kinase [Chloroflexota bacterium]MYF81208.1 HAMP domain-containing histidine kinase [Chloroflexota bacterium]MYI03933.1 HAMP domain-containing histidine kinase [Chloroflexota bacterium]